MNHIAAALLVSLAGKNIDKKSIEDVLASTGAKANPSIVESIVAATKNKKPDQIIKEGLSKLATSAGVSSGAASTTAPAETKSEDKKDDKKDDKKGGKKEAPKKDEKKKVVEETNDDDDVGFGGLF